VVTANYKKQLERGLLALGISLMIGIMVLGQEFRDSLGRSVGFFMDPLVTLLGASNFHIVLFIMAAITALYATLIQNTQWTGTLCGTFRKRCVCSRKSSERLSFPTMPP
jgi:uncharacterized membrane protein (DUF106 family)